MTLGLALLLLSSVHSGVPAAVPGAVHFTAAGDYSQNSNTAAVLNAMAAREPDLNLALGDLSYGVTGQEQSWCDFVTSRVGAGFPFELLAGNHESNGQNGHINDFAACLPNQLPGVVGTYGRQYYVDVPKNAPLVRYVMISPNLPFPDGTWNYNAGTARYNWTAAAIDGARAAGIPWVVVGVHKPCISMGQYSCDPGADITNLMLSKKVDLVLNGHEHLYQRSHQLAHGPGCATLTIGGYNAACVADSDSSFTAGAGTVFATIGTGGVSLRDVYASDSEAPYFATASGLNLDPTFGFLDFVVDEDSLQAQFIRGAGGSFTDSFTITKGEPGPNVPPAAAFSATPNGLTASFDASSSIDPDGLITSYAWQFGDGASGSGVTPQRTYAAAGTYDVTLTVTDDDGATHSVTQPVTATAPTGPTVLASDDYQRTVTTGWGQATAGGAWTSTSGSAFGVNNGSGRLTMANPGSGPSAFLGGVSSSDTDVRIELTLDKVPSGGSTSAHSSVLLRRVQGAGDYQVKLGFLSSGTVRVSLSRTASNGAETSLTGWVPVSGLTYTAGTSLTIRGQATGTSPTTLRAKVWRTGQAEPAGWAVTASNAQDGLQVPGAVGVKSYLSSSSTSAPLVARFDNLLVRVAGTLP